MTEPPRTLRELYDDWIKRANLIQSTSNGRYRQGDAETLRVCADELQKALAAERTSQPRHDSDMLLASAADLLNTWARENSVEHAITPEEIKGVINRLWERTTQPLTDEIIEIDEDGHIVRGQELAAQLRGQPPQETFNAEQWEEIRRKLRGNEACQPQDAREATLREVKLEYDRNISEDEGSAPFENWLDNEIARAALKGTR